MIGSGGSPVAGTGGALQTGGSGAGSGSGGSGPGGSSSQGTGTGGADAGSGGRPIEDAGVDGPVTAGGGRGAGGTAGRAQTGSGGGNGGGPAPDGGRGLDGGPATGMLKAAMVVQGAGTATAGDRVMLARLAAHGFQTTLFSDAAVTAALVAQMDLVVISSSAESGPLGTKIRDVTVPILCIENGEYPFMGMAGPTLNTDFGMDTNQSQVRITTAGSPLLAGLTGAVTISSVASDLGWVVPAAAAIRAATVGTNANHIAIFGYAKGDQMVGLTAPARRAGFAIRETLAANLSADGIKLFDAILEWVLQ